MTTFNKTAAAGIAALTIMTGAFAATSTPASAGALNVAPALNASTDNVKSQTTKVRRRWRRGRRWHRHHYGYGAAAGIIGFAAGAALAAQASRRDCWTEIVRKKRRNRYGERVIVEKRVRVLRLIAAHNI